MPGYARIKASVDTFSLAPGIGKTGGARRDRTADLLRAKQALSQLSYGPFYLSFLRQAALDLARAWSHTRLYAPGALAKSALPGTKNPA